MFGKLLKQDFHQAYREITITIRRHQALCTYPLGIEHARTSSLELLIPEQRTVEFEHILLGIEHVHLDT